MLFRVLAGKHTEGGKWVIGEDGSRTRVKGRVYKAGDIVDSDSDLNTLNSPGSKKFELVDEHGRAARNIEQSPSVGTPATLSPSPAPAAPVVQAPASTSQAPAPIVQAAPQPATGSPSVSPTPKPQAMPTPQDLEQMSVSELRALAAAEEVDLGSANRKEDIIKALRAANVTKAAEAGYKS